MTSSPALFPAVTVTVVRDRKIRTALRTNQIAGFVTVPSWKKINIEYFMESACVRCLHTSCGVSEIEQVSEANE